MEKFDDKEKRIDRMVNSLYVVFRNFGNEESCTFCKFLKRTDIQKYGMFVGKHSQENCFRNYYTIIGIIDEDKHNRLTLDEMEKTLDRVISKLNKWQERETNGC